MMEWLEMGGYALYVWGSYGVTAALMAAEVVALVRGRRTLLHRLGRISRNPPAGMKHETQT
jgi:heme exporter protein D